MTSPGLWGDEQVWTGIAFAQLQCSSRSALQQMLQRPFSIQKQTPKLEQLTKCLSKILTLKNLGGGK